MSQKTVKASPNHQQKMEQKEKMRDFDNRREFMLKEVKKLSEKYRIDIQGAMKYTPQGILAMVAFIDVKDQYEHMTEEAKKAEAEKKGNAGNGASKNIKLKV